MVVRNIPSRRKTPWQLDLGMQVVDGVRRRVQLHFATKGEAEEEMRKHQGAVRKHGHGALEQWSPAKVARYIEAERRLAAAGATIEEAVESLLRERVMIRERISMSQLVHRASAAPNWKEESDYNSLLKAKWRSFVLGREGVHVDAITPADVEAWLAAHEWELKTRQNNLALLSTLFRWAMKPAQGYAAKNPCKAVQLVAEAEDDDEEITCATPAQVRDLLHAVLKYGPALLWRPVIGFFGGVRSEERDSLAPEDIIQGENLVRIRAAVAKGRRGKRQRRVVELSANAKAWLKRWLKAKGDALKEWNARCAWWAARRVAGFWVPPIQRMKAPDTKIAELMMRPRLETEIAWPRNLERHTFASMHYAMHHDEAKLKALMGHHASEDTLHRHYRAVEMLDGRTITPSIAAEYWAIVP